jgi:hypothetical protein
MHWIRAHYTSRCACCGGKIKPGDRAAYLNGALLCADLASESIEQKEYANS